MKQIDPIITLAKSFIEVKSTADNITESKKILNIALSELNGFTVEKFEKNSISSILIHNQKKRPDKFKIMLNAHLDIVPGKSEQYNPVIKQDRLYGVGAMDMKASAATMILVFNEVAKKVNYPLALQLVTDEEIGGFNGTKYQIEKGIKADFVIAGESTQLHIAHQSKGIIWLKLTSRGKSAHGAYPWKGVNAVLKMNNLLNLLVKKYPVLKKEAWSTTLNISKIETSNNAFNKIPDDCTAWLDIRYIPQDSEAIIKNIKKLLPIDIKIETILIEPVLYTKEDNQYITLIQKITNEVTNRKARLYSANGSSDARHFSQIGCDGIEFGPKGGGIGSDNEWVDISSLENYYKILKQFLLRIN